jgi:hypothetical protein
VETHTLSHPLSENCITLLLSHLHPLRLSSVRYNFDLRNMTLDVLVFVIPYDVEPSVPEEVQAAQSYLSSGYESPYPTRLRRQAERWVPPSSKPHPQPIILCEVTREDGRLEWMPARVVCNSSASNTFVASPTTSPHPFCPPPHSHSPSHCR